MRTFLLFLICGILYLDGKGQSDSSKSPNCNFLNLVQFKDGKAKIEIVAIITEVGKVSDKEILKELENKGMLKSKDFGYALNFHPVGCNTTYYISSRDSSSAALSLFKLGGVETKTKLTCTVFEKYKLWDYPFFVIDKVQLD